MPGTGTTPATRGGLAGKIGGTLQLSLPAPVGLSGTFELVINTTGRRVQDTFTLGTTTLALDIAPGPYLRIAGDDVTLTIAGQTLQTDVTFEQVTLASGERILTLGVADGSLSLGGVVTVDQINGVLVIAPAGIAGRLSANLVIDLQPAISFSGRIELVLNNATTAIRRTIEVGGVPQQIDVPAGPFLRVEVTGTTPGTPATLSVLGLTVSGNFVLERSTTASGASIVRIGMSQVGLDLGGVVTLSNGSGVILMLPADPGPTPGTTVPGTGGLAGTISADVALNIPGITFSGSFGLQINTTNGAVNDSITVGGVPLTIELPAGPYLRVEGIGVTLGVAGVALSGDFAFERVTTDTTPGQPGGEVTAMAILANNVNLSLGGDAIEIFDGQGAFVIKPAGLAGRLAVSIRANLGGAVALGGTVTLEINQTGAAVTDSFQLGDETITLDLPAGPYLRVKLTGIGGEPAFLEIAGQRLEAASFSFEQQTARGSTASPGPPTTSGCCASPPAASG